MLRSAADPTVTVRRAALALALAALTCAGAASARDSDRNQPMNINAGHQEGTLDDTGVNTLTDNVVITQGTLEIHAARADIHRTNGDIARAVLSGSQASLKQQMNDGTWMNANADHIDYDTINDVIVMTGNYTVTTPRGSTHGQRLTYNLKTSRIESGGGDNGGRVTLTFVPKASQQNTPPKPSAPTPQGKP